jgi:alkylation response protein AidB-like acyl-CoA dehydrogenase
MGQGLRVACAVLDAIASRCPSTAMIYKMHLSSIATYEAAGESMRPYLEAAAQGKHLTTLAWSEKGSRSHFWAPTSKAVADGNGGVRVSAEKSWVTAAGHAQGYCISTGWAEGEAPTESMLYLMLAEDEGQKVAAPWNGTGMRGNASSPMTLAGLALGKERALSPEGKGLDVMLGVVLPWFQLGNAAISIGISEATVAATQRHLTNTSFDHLGETLSSLPTLRARLAKMRIETDKARAHLVATIDAAEAGSAAAQLLVLESKTVGAETALEVTDLGMRACGGAAFSRHLGVERYFRDARAASVMAPTSDVACEFIGRALCGMELF